VNKLTTTTLLLAFSFQALADVSKEFQISSFEVREIGVMESLSASDEDLPKPVPMPPAPTPQAPQAPQPKPQQEKAPGPTPMERVENAGKVISVAKDLVALGEAVYELVKKGKPTNVTEFAPVSVVPKDPATKEYVDPFDLEGFSIPEEKNFQAKIVNGLGKAVVDFRYKVIYSYGGSFNSTGKYLTNVMIVPTYVATTHGWDFNAAMRLSGVMNHGTKADPVAGALLVIKYQMNSWSSAFERNDTVHITGNGEVKTFR